MPRTYKSKADKGIVSLSGYKNTAKRIFDYGGPYRKVETDFSISVQRSSALS